MKRKPTDKENSLLTILLRHLDRLANEIANGLATERQLYSYNFLWDKINYLGGREVSGLNYYNDEESHLQGLYNYIIGPARQISRDNFKQIQQRWGFK
jgi:hypothetical protein